MLALALALDDAVLGPEAVAEGGEEAETVEMVGIERPGCPEDEDEEGEDEGDPATEEEE